MTFPTLKKCALYFIMILELPTVKSGTTVLDVYGNSGCFLSPNYPSTYPPNQSLTYTGYLASTGTLMVRIFFNLDLEILHNRCPDYVTISGLSYCGTGTLIKDISVTGSKLIMTFYSNSLIEKNGFNITFAVLGVADTTLEVLPIMSTTTDITSDVPSITTTTTETLEISPITTTTTEISEVSHTTTTTIETSEVSPIMTTTTEISEVSPIMTTTSKTSEVFSTKTLTTSTLNSATLVNISINEETSTILPTTVTTDELSFHTAFSQMFDVTVDEMTSNIKTVSDQTFIYYFMPTVSDRPLFSYDVNYDLTSTSFKPASSCELTTTYDILTPKVVSNDISLASMSFEVTTAFDTVPTGQTLNTDPEITAVFDLSSNYDFELSLTHHLSIISLNLATSYDIESLGPAASHYFASTIGQTNLMILDNLHEASSYSEILSFSLFTDVTKTVVSNQVLSKFSATANTLLMPVNFSPLLSSLTTTIVSSASSDTKVLNNVASYLVSGYLTSLIQRSCICQKIVPQAGTINTSREQQAKVNQIIKTLTIPKFNMSATIRRHISVQDHRPSATMMGVVGIIICIIPFVLILILDIIWMRSPFHRESLRK